MDQRSVIKFDKYASMTHQTGCNSELVPPAQCSGSCYQCLACKRPRRSVRDDIANIYIRTQVDGYMLKVQVGVAWPIDSKASKI